MEWNLSDGQTAHAVSVASIHHEFRVQIDATAYTARLIHYDPPHLTLLIDGHRVVETDVVWHNGSCQLHLANTPYRFEVLQDQRLTGERKSTAASASTITAPLPGRIVAVHVAPGDTVAAGQAVCVIEAMKMQNEICAPRAGIIAEVCIAVGTTVEGGAVLLRMQ